jgi:3-phenylpropionate/trans-cinnamate dioxygenase ferredoxin reductase component
MVVDRSQGRIKAMRADIAIIGAGETGARAALALRRLGFQGSLSLIGADPFEPYELPPLSKDFITSEGLPERKRIASMGDFQAANIDFQPATQAVSLDAGAKCIGLGNGSVVHYGRALLATGCAPRRLDVPGLPKDAVHMLRNAIDATCLRVAFAKGQSIVIIGGGFIGLELAASATRKGAHVTLIEGLDRILKRGVPGEIAEVVANRHRVEGVVIKTGVSVVSGIPTGSRFELHLSDGSHLAADAIVAGIGALPNVGLAQAAGLSVENGIQVDTQFRTSHPDVYAAGDCASYPHPVYGGRFLRLESWRAAVEHAAHVARAMLGETVVYETVPWFWSDQYDLTLQVAGLIDEGVLSVRRMLSDDAFVLCHLNGEGRIVAASGIGPGDVVARDVRLAEMLIQRRARPDPMALADPTMPLKSLLKAA